MEDYFDTYSQDVKKSVGSEKLDDSLSVIREELKHFNNEDNLSEPFFLMLSAIENFIRRSIQDEKEKKG